MCTTKRTILAKLTCLTINSGESNCGNKFKSTVSTSFTVNMLFSVDETDLFCCVVACQFSKNDVKHEIKHIAIYANEYIWKYGWRKWLTRCASLLCETKHGVYLVFNVN